MIRRIRLFAAAGIEAVRHAEKALPGTCAGGIAGVLWEHMTKLSVNINKVALLRNSRGRNVPDVERFAARCLELGAQGITLHPRPDQRHARYSDIAKLKSLCDERNAELNVEGYPSEEFLTAVLASRPAQCTLVPDAPEQLTSDHGWSVSRERALLLRVIPRLQAHGIRVSMFMDWDSAEFGEVKNMGADRIELYTEAYARAFGSDHEPEMLGCYRDAAQKAQQAGLGINAGHDLSLENLALFLTIPRVLEVSIGHALVAECLEEGLPAVIGRYSQILKQSAPFTR